MKSLERKSIIVMEGDQTGQELLEEALRVIDPSVTGLETEFRRYDLSLENRHATENGVVHEAAEAMKGTGLGIKAATITPEGRTTWARRTPSCAGAQTGRSSCARGGASPASAR